MRFYFIWKNVTHQSLAVTHSMVQVSLCRRDAGLHLQTALALQMRLTQMNELQVNFIHVKMSVISCKYPKTERQCLGCFREDARSVVCRFDEETELPDIYICVICYKYHKKQRVISWLFDVFARMWDWYFVSLMRATTYHSFIGNYIRVHAVTELYLF